MAAATLAAALVAGCPKPAAKDPKAAEGGAPTKLESQAEIARRFPAEPTVYRCLDADISQMRQVGGVVSDDFEPTERETTFAIDENTVTEIAASGSRREYHLTEFEFPPLNGYTLGPTYLDCEVECKETFGTKTSKERPAVVLLDDLVYVFEIFNVTDGSMFFNYACARGDAVAKLRSTNADGHRSKLFTYNDERSRLARYAMQAKDEQIVAEAKAREVAGWKAEAEADAQAEKLEREARLERARNNIVSITAKAGGNSPKDPVRIAVTAQLTDGTSMVIRDDESIFGELFDTDILMGDYKMIVEVNVKDDDSIRAETGEIAFTFADEHRFGCQGDPGATGVDTDQHGGMNFSGRRGNDGPALKVEIDATGVRTGKGDQILRYRLSCQGRTEVFTASATALVAVATTGGKGGYGVPRAYGATADGSNGGNGGDGGVITVIVDPSVETYNLKATSRGGEGGKGSEATDAARAGAPGKPGAEGPISTETASVEIR
jgi:hypothetical protein